MKRLAIALCALVAAVLVIPVNAQAAENTIRKGITIGGVDASGMTKEQADELVNNRIQEAAKADIIVNCVDDKSAVLKGTDINLAWKNKDITSEAVLEGNRGNFIERYKARKELAVNGRDYPIEYSVDEGAIRVFVEEQCLIYNNDSKEAVIEKTEDGFNVTPGEVGIHIDEDEVVSFLSDYILNSWNGKSCEVDIPVQIDDPNELAADFNQITDIIGEFETSYKTSSADRSANVANGCRLVNGTILYPGKEFSMYDHIKPFSIENGYRMAGSYMNGLVVDSLGGGICQVSTTLYNAVLLAELDVTERNNHSMIVSYVPASADAAIAESAGKDFRFVNSTDTPIFIEGYTTEDKKIGFRIYGKETRPSNRTVEYKSEVLETTPAGPENIIPSSDPVGFVSVQSAHIGYKAQLRKIVKVDGEVVSNEVINKSNYKMVPRTAVIGTATTDPTAAAQIQEAIATGSIDYARNVANAWKAIANQAAAALAASGADVNP